MIRKIAPLLNLILLTVAVYLAVGLFYKVAVSKLESVLPEEQVRVKEARPQEAKSGRQLQNYNVIADRNIFKVREAEGKTPAAVDLDKLKKTDLELRLLGTIAGLGKDSYAVIEHIKDHIQNLYKVGDSVDKARIKLILRKKVVLTMDGRDEVLEIPEERMAANTGTNIRKKGRSGGDAGNAETEEPPPGEVSHVELKRAEVEQSFNNVNDLMRNVRVRPNFSEGKPDGLRLDNVTAGSIFSEMGLQDKDVIIGVNSKRINSVDDCMEVYRNLSAASEMMLEVKRDGSNRFIKYTIR